MGSETVMARRIGPRGVPIAAVTTTRVSEFDPPRSWGFRAADGPVRFDVNYTIEPVTDGEHSRLAFVLDFEGHGIGKLLVPLIVGPKSRKEHPENVQNLKDILEQGS